MTPDLEALPGRVLLRFDPPVEQKGAIIIPKTSQRISEVGTVESMGDPLNEEQTMIRANIKIGDKLPVTYGSGVGWYFGDYEGGFAPIRAFTYGELAAKVKP